MEELLGFVETLTDVEHAALIAQYTERDDQVYHEARNRLVGLIHEGMRAPYRPGRRKESYFTRKAKNVAALVPRKTFMVARYEHPDYGALYRVWQGGNHNAPGMEGSFDRNIYVASIEGAMKVVGRSDRCYRCAQAGCSECKGHGWTYLMPPEFTDLGTPLEVRKLQPPSERYLSQYEALQSPST